MGELPGYDEWKTTDPNDDGSTEAIERLEAAIAADKDQVRDLCTNLLDKAGNEEISVQNFIALANAHPAMERLASSTLKLSLSDKELLTLAQIASLAARCYCLRENAIAAEALRQFNEPSEY